MSAVLDSLRSAWTEASPTLPGDGARRARALEEFLAAGLPTVREEDWKYTSLKRLDNRTATLPVMPDATAGGALAERLGVQGLDGPRLVFVNGHFVPSASDAGDTRLEIGSLGAALAAGFPHDRLGSVIDLQRYRFAQLNAALFADGAVVRAPRGVVEPRPVYLLFLTLGDEDALPIVQPRIWIEAEAGAELTVIEHHTGERGDALSNVVTEAVAHDNSRITHFRVQEQAPAHIHIAGLNIRLERDARVHSHNIDFGGGLVRNDLHARLVAPGAELTLDGLYFTGGTQHVDNHTRVDHLAPQTRSTEDYRGVLDGQSRAVFNGKVLVAEDAQKIEAHQSNPNLLLNRRCEVDTKPELEIYADDVKCSHGATVGQLDTTALFYLRSRGIDADTARSLLTFAFANDVIGRIGVEPLRERLAAQVLGRLPEGESIRELT